MHYLQLHPDHDRMASVQFWQLPVNGDTDSFIFQIIEVAEGLQYLHHFNPNIVHADIKGVGIFICDQPDSCF